MNTHPAPWDRSLQVISALGTLLLVTIVVTLVTRQSPTHSWFGLIPLLIVVGCALFTVRGYTLAPDALLVQRLLWQTPVSLAGLQSVEHRPNAMARSIRTFGNGGLFSFTGRFRNQTLGSYHAYVTDRQRTVVLHFEDKTIVISPGDPDLFVAELQAMKGL